MITRRSTVHATGSDSKVKPMDQIPYNSILHSGYTASFKISPLECVYFNGSHSTINDSPFQERKELAKGTIVTLFQE